MIREIQRLWQQFVDTFIAKRVKYVSGLTNVSESAARQCLNKRKYSHCTKQRKKIVTTKDWKKRKRFVKTVTNTLRSDFWTNYVSFFFLWKIFSHKNNSLKEAGHCKTRAWRLRSEALSRISKWKEELLVNVLVFFLVYDTRRA